MEIKEYKLEDISFVKNGTKNKKDHSLDGKYNFYVRSKNILKSNDWTIDGKYTIIPGEGIFHPIWNEGKAAVHQRVYYIKANEKFIMDKYLYYWWIKNNDILYKNSVGTTVKSLRLNNFKKPNIKLPSINTQQKIINIIEPKEELFLKFNNIIDITSLENFNKTWSYLINIIEPFEKLKIKLNNKIDKLKFILNNFEDDIDNKFIFLNKNNICTGKRNADFASENGEYRFFTCSINKKQYCNSYKFDDEVILLSGNGDVGEIQYYKGKFDAYQRTYIIQHELIGNIYYSLLKNKKMFLKKSNGSVVKFLTLSTILSIKISNNRLKNKEVGLTYLFVA